MTLAESGEHPARDGRDADEAPWAFERGSHMKSERKHPAEWTRIMAPRLDVGAEADSTN